MHHQAVLKLSLVDRCQHLTALRHIIELLAAEGYDRAHIARWCMEHTTQVPRLDAIAREVRDSSLLSRIERVCALLGIK